MNSSLALPRTALFQYASAAVLAACLSDSASAQNIPPAGSGLPPGAIQQPAYRQPGSAYQPPTPAAPPMMPPSTGQYQPGFGTPPKGTPQKTGTALVKAPAKSVPAPSTKAPGSSLEARVSKLEKNDIRQDQRLISLEAGAARSPGGVAGIPASASGKTYVVRPGDALPEIAARHGTTTAALRAVNHLPGDELYIGQTLDLPTSRPVETAIGGISGIHVVKSGEVFSILAERYGVSQDALARANPAVYPDKLLVGERLRIPAGARSAPSSSIPKASSPAVSKAVHVVGRGESLGAIAKKYGIPTASLASANKLKNPNIIVPGQRLVIPGGTRRPAAPVLPAAFLPKPAAPEAPATPAKAPAPAPVTAPAYPDAPRQTSNSSRGVVAYRLERGDDIHTVANMFSTTEQKIREMNKLPSEKKLKEGDEIVVPALGAVSLN